MNELEQVGRSSGTKPRGQIWNFATGEERCEPGEDEITDSATHRRLGGIRSRAADEVVFAEARHQPGRKPRSVLAIAVDDDNEFPRCPTESGLDGCAVTLVVGMPEYVGASLTCLFTGAVG